ncbi:hypothetical protein [Paenibacillus peoriae]|nr:hypothetical protein [Paenibacillus peoriae]
MRKGNKRSTVVHGRNGDVGFEGATPRVEGSSDRCCRWIPGLE